MKIVVATSEPSVAEHACEILGADGNAVEIIHHSAARAELASRPPHALLVWLPIDPTELRELCAADTTRSTYVIAVVPEHLPARTMSSAIAAGCHDVLQAPFTDEELCARVEVLERLRGWHLATRPGKRCVEEARAWRFLADIVADDLEGMLGQKVSITRRATSMAPPVRIASIPMVLASDHLELFIALVADANACRWLGDNLLCEADPSAEMLDDILREMANVAGGAVKRAMLPEGLVLSTGLPVGGDANAIPKSSSLRSWCIVIDRDVSLTVIADVRERPSRRVPARALIEGMILVDDVRTGAGVLLLPAGTRLTEHTADKLRQLDLGLVEVSAAA